MTPPTPPPPDSQRPVGQTVSWTPAIIVGTVSLLLTLVPLLRAEWIFSNDGAEHLYSAWILANEHALSDSERALVETHQPYSSYFFPMVWGLANVFLDWRGAFTAAIIAMVSLFHVAASLFLLQQRPERWPLLALLPCVSFGWMFHLGFYNYVGGLSLALLLQPLVSFVREWRLIHTALLSLSLVLISICHPLAAVVAGLLVLGYSALAPDEESSGPPVLTTILAGIPVLALVVFQSQQHLAMQHHEAEEGSLLVVESWLTFLRTGIPGPWALTVLPSLVALLAPSVALVWSIVARRKLFTKETFLIWVALLFWGLWMTMPFSMDNWEGFSPRFAPVALLAGLACLPLANPVARRVALVAASALGVSMILWTDSLYQRLGSGCADFLAALESPADIEGAPGFVSYGGCLGTTSLIDEPFVPRAQFTLHFGAALGVASSAISSGFQGNPSAHTHSVLPARNLLPGRPFNPSQHALWMSELEARPTDQEAISAGWLFLREYIAARGLAWVYAPELWVQQALSVDEFVFLRRFGNLHLVEYRTCRMMLHLTGEPQRAFRIDHGWLAQPVDRPWETIQFSSPLAQGTLHIGPSTCGPVWIQLYDEAGEPLSCANHPDSGAAILPAAKAGSTREVTCEVTAR